MLLLIIFSVSTLFLFNHFRNSDFISISVNQWGLSNNGQEIEGNSGKNGVDINIIKAWEITKGSEDVIIGILDTGIEINNIEIKDAIYTNPNEISDGADNDGNSLIDDINGWDFYNYKNKVYSNYLHDNHGTYLAGIIAASYENGNIYGIAPKVKILPLKFMSGTNGQISDAIKAIEYAHSLGVRIINCSWDSAKYDEELYQTMKKYNDILFVCSAGKKGEDLSVTPVYPACFDLPNILSVAAIDNKGDLYIFSGYGDRAHVAAPGVDIYSCLPDGDYIFSSGTSSATAYITGVAALIKSYCPELGSKQIAAIIKDSVREIDNLNGKVESSGYVDAYKCLLRAKEYLSN